ncbi:hypothetical protein QBC41DRAFT_43713 [Cercophora samala]|uniref:C2H2-type domain-containing protein n=1 Tax=Cercophora samala TaxID=330535 RepID=A0AA40D215_9PEZI|nr:hypothetical protein QBC41DRAFT_43713 [Cercophora samala]
MRHLCTTMPWTIWPALVVLWGVCWMFIYPPLSDDPFGHDNYGPQFGAEYLQAFTGLDSNELDLDALAEGFQSDSSYGLSDSLQHLQTQQMDDFIPSFRSNPTDPTTSIRRHYEFPESQPFNFHTTQEDSVQQINGVSGVEQVEDDEHPASGLSQRDEPGQGHITALLSTARNEEVMSNAATPSTANQSLLCPVPGCPHANKPFTRPSSLKRHMEHRHKPSPTTKSFECPYENCKRAGKRSAFDRKDGLERHLLKCKSHLERASSSHSVIRAVIRAYNSS